MQCCNEELPQWCVQLILATGKRDSGTRLAEAAQSQLGVTTGYDPAYTRIAYPNGDVPRTTGVCADVVIRAGRDALSLNRPRRHGGATTTPYMAGDHPDDPRRAGTQTSRSTGSEQEPPSGHRMLSAAKGTSPTSSMEVARRQTTPRAMVVYDVERPADSSQHRRRRAAEHAQRLPQPLGHRALPMAGRLSNSHSVELSKKLRTIGRL